MKVKADDRRSDRQKHGRWPRAICHGLMGLVLTWSFAAHAERDAAVLDLSLKQADLPTKSIAYVASLIPGDATVGSLIRKVTAGQLWEQEPLRAADKLPILEFLEAHGLHLGMTDEEVEHYKNHGRRPPPTLNTSVDFMQLRSGKAINVLHRLGIKTFLDAEELTIQELFAQPHIGSGTVNDMAKAFARAGFPLARDQYELELRRLRASSGRPSALDDLVIESPLPAPAKTLIFSTDRDGHRRFMRREHVTKLHAADLRKKNAFTNRAIEAIYNWLDTKGLRLGLNESDIAAYRATGKLPRATSTSSVDALGRLSAKGVHALDRLSIKLLEDAEDLTIADLRALPAVGDAVTDELTAAFARVGFPLSDGKAKPRHDQFLQQDVLELIRRGEAEFDPSLPLRSNVMFDGHADQDQILDFLWRHEIANLGQLVDAYRSGRLDGTEWIFINDTLNRLNLTLATGCAAKLVGTK